MENVVGIFGDLRIRLGIIVFVREIFVETRFDVHHVGESTLSDDRTLSVPWDFIHISCTKRRKKSDTHPIVSSSCSSKS